MQAKDVDDRAVLRAVIEAGGTGEFSWAMWRDVEPSFPDVPWGVLVAKVRALNRRGLLDACVHNGKIQCRGDIWVTEAGYAYLAPAQA